MLLGLLCSGALFAFHSWWAPWLNLGGLTNYQAGILSLLVLSRALAVPIGQFLSLNYHAPILNKTALCVQVVNILAFYAAYLLVGITISSMLTVTLAGSCVQLAIYGFMFARTKRGPVELARGLRLLRKDLPEMLKYGGPLLASSWGDLIVNRRGQEYFIQTLLGPAALGLYAIGVRIETLGMESTNPKSLRQYVGTHGFEIWDAEGPQAAKAYINKYLGIVWFMLGLFALPTVAVLPYALRVIYQITDPAAVFYLQCYIFSIVVLRWLPILSGFYVLAIRRASWCALSKCFTFPAALVLYPCW